MNQFQTPSNFKPVDLLKEIIELNADYNFSVKSIKLTHATSAGNLCETVSAAIELE